MWLYPQPFTWVPESVFWKEEKKARLVQSAEGGSVVPPYLELSGNNALASAVGHACILSTLGPVIRGPLGGPGQPGLRVRHCRKQNPQARVYM